MQPEFKFLRNMSGGLKPKVIFGFDAGGHRTGDKPVVVIDYSTSGRSETVFELLNDARLFGLRCIDFVQFSVPRSGIFPRARACSSNIASQSRQQHINRPVSA